jgi:D-alanyl-lipoteichoic acid acyltransferase DltB (MBOAT superfamily)
VYIPLGGSRGGTWNKIRNVFIIFLVSGFWHGANWTFIIWGAINALYFIPLFITNKNRNNLDTVAQGKYLPSIKELLLMLITFSLTVFAWIFFRAENINHAFEYISEIFSESLFKIPSIKKGFRTSLPTIFLVMFFVMIEWFGREGQYAIAKIGLKWKKPFRYLLYYTIIIIIFWFGGKNEQFIYFQF